MPKQFISILFIACLYATQAFGHTPPRKKHKGTEATSPTSPTSEAFRTPTKVSPRESGSAQAASEEPRTPNPNFADAVIARALSFQRTPGGQTTQQYRNQQVSLARSADATAEQLDTALLLRWSRKTGTPITQRNVIRYLRQLNILRSNSKRGRDGELLLAQNFQQLRDNNVGNGIEVWTETLPDGTEVSTRPDFVGSKSVIEVKSKNTKPGRGVPSPLYRTRQLRAQEVGAKKRGLLHRIIIITDAVNPDQFPHISRGFHLAETRIRLIAGLDEDGLRPVYRYAMAPGAKSMTKMVWKTYQAHLPPADDPLRKDKNGLT